MDPTLSVEERRWMPRKGESCFSYEARLSSGATCGNDLAYCILTDMQQDREMYYWSARYVEDGLVTVH